MGKTIHGMNKEGKRDSLYNTWANMKSRCKKPTGKNACYEGISLCDEWKDFYNFMIWAKSSGYDEGLTIERKDVTQDYKPDNCTWVTKKEQQRNKSNTHWLTYQGKTQSLSAWAEELGIPRDTLKSRIYRGFDVERALLEPLGVGRRDAINNKRKRDEKGRVI